MMQSEKKDIIKVLEIRTDVTTDIAVTHDFEEAMAIVRDVFAKHGGTLVKMRCASMRRDEYEKLEDA